MYTQPAVDWVPVSLTVDVKWPGSETDDLHPYSAKVKKMWSQTSTPHIHLCMTGTTLE